MRRSDQTSSVHPDPPAWALAQAVNSARQRSDRPEVALYGRRQSCGRIAAGPAQSVEVDFMEDDGARRNELLALEAVHVEDRRRRPVKVLQPLVDGVQATESAAVVVLVVAREEPLREALEPRRLEQERCDRVGHR